jgi:hypothetical protein
MERVKLTIWIDFELIIKYKKYSEFIIIKASKFSIRIIKTQIFNFSLILNPLTQNKIATKIKKLKRTFSKNINSRHLQRYGICQRFGK